MKIAFFTDTYFPQINGVSFVVRNHAKKLMEKGHYVEIFAPSGNKNDKNKVKDTTQNINDNLQVNYLNSLDFIFYPEYRIAIPSLKEIKNISEKNFDIIHCHTPFSAGILGIIIKKFLSKKNKRIPLVGTYHTMLQDFSYVLPFPEKITKKIIEKYTIKFYNYMDCIIAPGEYTKNFIKKDLNLKKPVFVVSNGIDLNLFNIKNQNECKKIREKYNIGNCPLILHVGRISKERNVEKIIYSASLIIKKFPNAKFLIVGDGPEINRLKNLRKKLNLQNNVIFTGKIEQKFLPYFYTAADVFVTASTIDTQGLVVLEAFACGTPVVAANAKALPELVKENETGFLFDPNNVNDLWKKIEKILENPEIKKNFSHNVEKLLKKHNIENSIDKLIEIYKNLL